MIHIWKKIRISDNGLALEFMFLIWKMIEKQSKYGIS